jgi:predicted RNA-binding protein with PIN domain
MFVPEARKTVQHGGKVSHCQPNLSHFFPSMARNFLLVDAHNVIFARPDLAGLHRRNGAAARARLTGILERYQDATGIRVVAVFDGGSQARTASEVQSVAGIQTIYPSSAQTADAIIERLVAKYATLHQLTVATNDSLVRTAAAAAGALVIDVDTLFDDIARAEGEMAATLGRLRKNR